MRWIRSWPKWQPGNRAHVYDNLERLWIDNYDYTPLGNIREDICLLEWDIAADRLMRERFERTAASWHEEDPDKIVVAPYLLHEARPQSVWAHRHVDKEGKETWIEPHDTEADYFGFGMIFLPHHLVRAFLKSPAHTRGTPIGIEPDKYDDERLTDQTFSVWYHRWYEKPAYVDWQVVPVHLNEGRWA